MIQYWFHESSLNFRRTVFAMWQDFPRTIFSFIDLYCMYFYCSINRQARVDFVLEDLGPMILRVFLVNISRKICTLSLLFIFLWVRRPIYFKLGDKNRVLWVAVFSENSLTALFQVFWCCCCCCCCCVFGSFCFVSPVKWRPIFSWYNDTSNTRERTVLWTQNTFH